MSLPVVHRDMGSGRIKGTYHSEFSLKP